MTKRADLGVNSLFCTNLCSLLKIAKKLCAQSKNDKMLCFWAQNYDLQKLGHFTENDKKWCALCENDKMC